MKGLRGLAAVAAAVSFLSTAGAAEVSDGWVELKPDELSRWTYDDGKVRVSNCNVKKTRGPSGYPVVVPACYAFNDTAEAAVMTVQFIATDKDGGILISVTLAPLIEVASGTAEEIREYTPAGSDDFDSIASYRLRVRLHDQR